MSWLRWVMPATILAVAAVSRVQPHPPNFTPIGAIVLFGGAHFASPLGSVPRAPRRDGLQRRDHGWHRLAPLVCVSFAVTVLLAR